jgi:hypothetical protein
VWPGEDTGWKEELFSPWPGFMGDFSCFHLLPVICPVFSPHSLPFLCWTPRDGESLLAPGRSAALLDGAVHCVFRGPVHWGVLIPLSPERSLFGGYFVW